jgi:hypothetical protein
MNFSGILAELALKRDFSKTLPNRRRGRPPAWLREMEGRKQNGPGFPRRKRTPDNGGSGSGTPLPAHAGPRLEDCPTRSRSTGINPDLKGRAR